MHERSRLESRGNSICMAWAPCFLLMQFLISSVGERSRTIILRLSLSLSLFYFSLFFFHFSLFTLHSSLFTLHSSLKEYPIAVLPAAVIPDSFDQCY